ITLAGPDALANVKVDDGRQVKVAALRGRVRVANAAGVVVAKLEPGAVLGFEPQAGAAMATRAAGCLLVKNGKPILLDQTTNVLLELEGSATQTAVGSHVKITGFAKNMPSTIDGASQVIHIADLIVESKGGCKAIAAKLGASAVGVSSGQTAVSPGTATTVTATSASASAGVSAG